MKKRVLTLGLLFALSQAYSQNNLTRLMKGENGVSKQFTEIPARDQVSFSANNARMVLGLDSRSDLKLIGSQNDNLGYTHYRFIQTFEGVPIENSMLIAHVKGGKLVAVTGDVITEFPASMPSVSSFKMISANDAVQKAIKHVGASKYMWQDVDMEARFKEQMKNAKATLFPKVEKVWYYNGDDINAVKMELTYKIDVYAAEPESRAFYFVNVSNGNIVGKEDRIHTTDVAARAFTLYSGQQLIYTEKTGKNSFRLRDYTRGDGIITLQAKGKEDFTNNSRNWNLTTPEQNGLDAHWGVSKTYDYYKATFNRNSIDDKGMALYSYVNKGGFLYRDNAGWDGNAMNYGKRSGSQNGVTGIDVTGHELTHGVTEYTCDLVYSGESGGMNESLSDIMGKNVQFFAKPDDIDWRLSNDMNWFIRDMSNPKAYQQPDCYGGQYWKSNADVHVLSGVGNFMYYILVEGKSGVNDLGNSYNVQGIGLDKAQQIMYRTQTVYLTPTSKYADWRTASINAATDLYGASSNEVAQVKNAWYAVGVGSPAFNAIADTESNQLISVYPNPIHGTVAQVKFDLKSDGNIVIKVYNRSGAALQVYNAGRLVKGSQTFTLSRAAELKTGQYYVTIEQDGKLTGRVNVTVLN